jgi:hypothetical protein
MSIRRTIILASTLVALPISILLIGSAIERRKHNSTSTPELLRQPKSTTVDSSNSRIITPMHDHQQKEISQSPLPTQSQGSETITVTEGNRSTNIGSKSKPNNYLTSSVLTSQPILPSENSGSDVIVSNHPAREDETSLSDQSKETKKESLRELIVAAFKKARDSEKEKGPREKEHTFDEATTTDSKVIHSLDKDLHAHVNLFEETLSAIRKENYDKQVKLLDSYKEFLKKQLEVIHARGKIARKLKPGA